MPKRTNPFQELIAFIEAALAGHGAKVTESALVKDTTGAEVEVDVLIEAVTGGHTVRIAVECRGRGRKATKEWVRELMGKYATLPTIDVAVAVSESGFTKGAIELACLERIRTVTLEEARAVDWAYLTSPLATIEYSHLKVTRTNILLGMTEQESVGALAGIDLNQAVLYRPDGTLRGPTNQVFSDFLKTDEYNAAFNQLQAHLGGLTAAPEEEVALRFTLPDGYYFAIGTGERYGLTSLTFAFKAEWVATPTDIARYAYREAQVIVGAQDIDGIPASLVIVEQPGGFVIRVKHI